MSRTNSGYTGTNNSRLDFIKELAPLSLLPPETSLAHVMQTINNPDQTPPIASIFQSTINNVADTTTSYGERTLSARRTAHVASSCQSGRLPLQGGDNAIETDEMSPPKA